MKSALPGYYIDENYINEVWNKPLIVLDTNILLSFYSYKEENRVKILEALKDVNLWIPYQVAYEYEKNRENVINEHLKKYEQIVQIPVTVKNRFYKTISEFERHPSGSYSDIEAIFEDFYKVFDRNFNVKIKNKIKNEKKTYSSLKKEDLIQKELNQLIKNRVGNAYTYSKILSIVEEGKSRYENKIPPGYQDLYQLKKHGIDAFGDLILWYQIIDFAINDSHKHNIIFVTNDEKEDWWRLDKQGKIVEPREELINELFSLANVKSYYYTFDEFYIQLNKRVHNKDLDQIEKELGEIKNVKNNFNRINKIYNISELVSYIKEQKENEYTDENDVDSVLLDKVKKVRDDFAFHFITSHIYVWHNSLNQLCFNIFKKINEKECIKVANIMIQKDYDNVDDHLITLSDNTILNTSGNIEDNLQSIINWINSNY